MREGDISSDVALTGRMTQAEAEAVSGFGRTAFGLQWFWGRGLRHSPGDDAWREYGRNTAHLPDAKLREVWCAIRPAHHRSRVGQI